MRKLANSTYIGSAGRPSLIDLEIPETFNGELILFVHGFMGFKDWGAWHLVQQFFTEKNYPRRLKQCADAPLLLYTKGNIDWNPDKLVSIVGTRHATDYGKGLTQELIEGLAGEAQWIVEGGSLPTDIT